MSKKLYVGNLSYTTSENDLNNIFSKFGNIATVSLITDRETGRSKGFAFVEMETEESASEAIDGLDGTDQDGRTIKVNLAKPQEKRSQGGGGYRNNRNDRY